MRHIIRLRGPWQYAFAAEGGRPASVVQVPCELAGLVGPDFSGVVLFSRRFNRPTGLDDAASIHLELADSHATVCVRLNGVALDAADGLLASARFDVTHRLRTHNLLEIEMSIRPAAEGRFSGAELSIEAIAR